MYDGPLQDLIDALAQLPGIGPKGAQRIAFHVLDAPDEEVGALADALREVKEKARFCDICFNVSSDEECQYCRDPRRDQTVICVVEESKDVVAVDHVALDIAPGEFITFLGPSGCGKTTTLRMIAGFEDTTSGQVVLDGQNMVSLPPNKRPMSMVFQSYALFPHLSVRENIAYADPDASDERVRAAAEAAYAHRFVEAFDDGYEQVIGERGLRLSGGQKQRIAVARAVLKDAPILVLDEATSALDTKSERLVQAALEELMVGRSSLIVAHRLSTIASVDRIVTLRGGQVQEIGTPAELAASGGIYAQLLDLQRAGTQEARKMLKEYGLSG